MHRGNNPLLTPLLYDFRRMTGRRKVNRKVKPGNAESRMCRETSSRKVLRLISPPGCLCCVPQMSFHVIYKAPCGLCLRNMAEIERYLFQTRCDFIFLEMFCLDPYVLVDRPFQPQRPFYYIADITCGREDIPLSCVNEIDSTPPPKVLYSKNRGQNKGTFKEILGCEKLIFNRSKYHDLIVKKKKVRKKILSLLFITFFFKRLSGKVICRETNVRPIFLHCFP